MIVSNSVSRPTSFQSSPVATAPAHPVDVELGVVPNSVSQAPAAPGLQLVAPGDGPMMGAGKTKTTGSYAIPVALGVTGLLFEAIGLAVGLGPDNNSGRWIGGWVGAWCGVGAVLLAASGVTACMAKRTATNC